MQLAVLREPFGDVTKAAGGHPRAILRKNSFLDDIGRFSPSEVFGSFCQRLPAETAFGYHLTVTATVVINVESPLQDEVAILLRQSGMVAARHYPGENRRPITPAILAKPDTHVHVVRLAGEAVGLYAVLERANAEVEPRVAWRQEWNIHPIQLRNRLRPVSWCSI